MPGTDENIELSNRAIRASGTSLPEIPIATHSFRQRYLFAFATQAEVSHHIRTQALEAEGQRIEEIMRDWEVLQSRVADLINREAGHAETIRISRIPDQYQARTDALVHDQLFQKTFSQLRISLALVEIDKLVAPQRSVNLDYVDRLLASYPASLTIEHLLDICLSPKRAMDPIQHLEIAPNTHIFSSPNSDIRFLGAFGKDLATEDLKYAVSGGLPGAAIIAFIGYGGAPINVLQAGNRLVLNNGFHRAYALRSVGIAEIPVVVQHVRNPQLEFPIGVAGVPKEYLLGHSRPVLMKDFSEPNFAITLRVRERMKVVTVAVNVGQHEVPS